jgi:ABC-type nitrate/sulfonate/bicarbonate transport system substrate-binding protein
MRRHAPYVSLLALIAAAAVPAFAQEAPGQQAADTEYEKTLNDRAGKVLAQLQLSDEAKAARVSDAVKAYYRGIRDADAERDAALAKLKEANPKPDEAAVKAAQDERQTKAEAVVTSLSDTISKDLSPEQVETVKNQITYNVLNVTYAGFLAMLPDLTETQKTYIRTQLTEARDKALTGGSSHERHGWFGKYKGRINNQLSKEGIDLNKASKEWAERRKAATTPSTKPST